MTKCLESANASMDYVGTFSFMSVFAFIWRFSPFRCINVGPDFQADLPPFYAGRERSGVWQPGEESPREQLLWKPCDELEDSASLQDQGKRQNTVSLPETCFFNLQ